MLTKPEILEFMETKLLMVLSSVNAEGKPQSAVVGFGQTENFELIFGTDQTSRKATNIADNKNVSVVIGWDDNGTVQYEGTARRLSGEEADKYAEMYFAKNPLSKKYKDEPNECYYLITPNWLRFTSLKNYPWDVTELKF